MSENINEKYDPEFVAESRQEFWKNQGQNVYRNNFKIGANRREFIGKLMKKNDVSSILEIGCNSCPNLAACNEHCPGAELAGIDICQGALDFAKNVAKVPAKLTCGSLYDLSCYKDNSFDVVFSCTVLQHIPSEKVQGVLEEMKRISKYFVFVIEDHHDADDKVYWYRDGVPQRCTTNYVTKFQALGMAPTVYKMEDLINETSIGGAHYLVYAEKTDKEFIVDRLENM